MRKLVFCAVVLGLLFVAYPKRQEILCNIFPENVSCAVPEPVIKPVAEQSSQQVYKWVDESGVIHYGEKPVEGAVRIDDKLTELSVISGGAEAMERNQGATSQLRGTKANRNYSSGSYDGKKVERERKKRRLRGEGTVSLFFIV